MTVNSVGSFEGLESGTLDDPVYVFKDPFGCFWRKDYGSDKEAEEQGRRLPQSASVKLGTGGEA